MKTSTSCERAYMTAITLNNAGVTLLEKNCPQAAMGVFSDAVEILKEITAFSSTPQARSRQRTPDFYFPIHCQIERANYKLKTALPDSDLQVNFRVLTEEDYAAVVGTAIKKDANTFTNPSTGYHLTRIEMRGRSIQECDAMDVDLDGAIVLNNFGICYDILAQIAATYDEVMMFRAGAYKLFELAHSLLQSKRESDDYVPLSILIVGNLVRSASILEMEVTVEVYSDHMVLLQESLLEMDYLLSVSDQRAAAAA